MQETIFGFDFWQLKHFAAITLAYEYTENNPTKKKVQTLSSKKNAVILRFRVFPHLATYLVCVQKSEITILLYYLGW